MYNVYMCVYVYAYVWICLCMYACVQERKKKNESLLFIMTRRWLVVKLAPTSFSTTCIKFWIAVFSYQRLEPRRVYPCEQITFLCSGKLECIVKEKERKRETESSGRSGRLMQLDVLWSDHVAQEFVWSIEMMRMLLFPRMWMSVAVDWIIKVNILMAQMNSVVPKSSSGLNVRRSKWSRMLKNNLQFPPTFSPNTPNIPTLIYHVSPL